MPDVARTVTIPSAASSDEIEAGTAVEQSVSSSSVVGNIFDQLLGSIYDGDLLPGQRINDFDLAQELGVSRTPVREALQRLREIGVIQASAGRFTRVAIVKPQQTIEALVVWVALYGALINEVIGSVPAGMIAAMETDHELFTLARQSRELRLLATSNSHFFHHLETLSSNPTLRRSLSSVVHVIRLGTQSLPDHIDFHALGEAQVRLLVAARDGDPAAGHDALRLLTEVSIPARNAAAGPPASAAAGGDSTPADDAPTERDPQADQPETD